MRNLLSRCLLFGLLLAWALSHATVFGQQNGKPTVSEKLRQGLDKSLTLDYSGQSLSDSLNHLRDKTGLTINVDQLTLQQMGLNLDDPVGLVQIKASNEKASQVLRKVLSSYRLTYVVCEDAVLITTEEMAIVRQMRQRVSVDLEDVPFKKAVRELARTHGVNVVIDPKVVKQIETPVSLQIDNTGIETTIRLLAELANLKAVRMGNVMFVTSEDKAKRIRDEESHQYDNLMNPNLPSNVNAPVGFGGGGGAGGAFGGAVPVPGIAPKEAVPPPGIELPAAPDAKKLDPQEEKAAPKKPLQQKGNSGVSGLSAVPTPQPVIQERPLGHQPPPPGR